jgi:hypothetical protein
VFVSGKPLQPNLVSAGKAEPTQVKHLSKVGS